MNLVEFVCFKALVVELEAKDKNAVINELVQSLDDAGCLQSGNVDKIAKAITRRENEASTGLGKGVAVPHVKSAIVEKPVAAVGLSGEGLDFNSLDKQPVYCIFLMVSPADNEKDHLQAMECMFNHLQKDKFRSFLRQCKSIDEIEDLFQEADENPEL